MATTPERSSGNRTGGHKDRPWIPRFWDGMDLSAWWRLLVRNRFRVAPQRIPMAMIVTVIAAMNSALAALQAVLLGRKIARTELAEHPIFIIGHWRSGTTLLHELLALDPRHTYPDTYACFAPNHFLMSRHFLRPMTSILMPAQRPIDNMPAGWDRPQEDEFALCNMGVPSPYLWLAFPNRPLPHQEYFDLEDVPLASLARWKRKFVWFLKCVTIASPKRIVLKSPPHTFRIRVLLDLFPKARFIHIYRDPYVVFPSTVNLWKRLSRDQGLQAAKHENLREQVFETFTRMYEVFRRDRAMIDPSRFCEVSYEALVEDPVGQMREIYEKLELGEFEAVLPALESRVAAQANYQTNRYETSPETREEIGRRWAPFIEEYGYAEQLAEP